MLLQPWNVWNCGLTGPVYSKVFQPWHHQHFGLDYSLFEGCPVQCRMTVAFPNCDNQMLPNVPWGTQNCPQLRTTGLYYQCKYCNSLCVMFSTFINIHVYNSPLYLVPKRLLIRLHGYIKYKIAWTHGRVKKKAGLRGMMLNKTKPKRGIP